ncbi:MAG: DUF547 domain-containing protein [Ferruginibacter sp.]|nr:DUF547 domain-containing protein [Ferruginibacter sp.]
MKKIIFILCTSVWMSACTSGQTNTSVAPSHEKWSALLQKYVSSTGKVNYKGIKADKAKLDEYLALLSKQKPGKNWTRNETLAFWINAYNAYTVKLITDNYPVKSIKDLNPTISVIFVSTVWDKKFFSIGGEKMSLNNIEHGILRKMNEPRMHFTIVCASVSCPKLLNTAYEAATLENQFNKAAKDFLADNTKNQVNAGSPKLSKIFDWFGGDFKVNGQSKIEFINRFTTVKIDKNAGISYLDYNWNLNE